MANIELSEALKEYGVYGDRAEFELTSPEIGIALNDDGVTWTKIPNMVLNLGKGFSVTAGTLKKINNGGTFLINGVSDLAVNKACTMSYGLAVNGSAVAKEITPHTFTAAAKVENISITAFAELGEDDEIEVWAKGDGTLGVELDITKLDVTFKENGPDYT